jgi:uncharacterized repeat protein (TIGR04076 family)
MMKGLLGMSKVKITVMRKMKTEDVLINNLPEVTDMFHNICPRPFTEGDVFISENGQMPEGFCS